MRILIDARCIRRSMSGVGLYTQRLAGALAANFPEDEFLLLGLEQERDFRRQTGLEQAANLSWLETAQDPESHPAGDIWLWRRLPGIALERGAELIHGPAFLVPPGACPLPRVLTVHDLSVFARPGDYPLGFRLYLRRAVARGLAVAARAIFPSAHAAGEAARLFPGRETERWAVVHEAADPAFGPGPEAEDRAVLAPLHLPERFLLAVGTFESRKNPGFVLDLYKAFEASGFEAPPLLWVGRRGRGAEALERGLGPLMASGRLRRVEGLSLRQLAGLYRGAEALVYPSFYEGFGLPVVEALASGLPVVACDGSCLREVLGAGGDCLPLDRPGEWARALSTLLGEPARREEARRRALARAEDFSWCRCARETMAVYRAARGEGAS